MRFRDVARALLVTGAAAAAVLLLLPRRRRETFLANERSGVYHTADCPRAPEAERAVRFPSRAAAEAAGYRPCRVCGG